MKWSGRMLFCDFCRFKTHAKDVIYDLFMTLVAKATFFTLKDSLLNFIFMTLYIKILSTYLIYFGNQWKIISISGVKKKPYLHMYFLGFTHIYTSN